MPGTNADQAQARKLHLGCGKRYIPGFIHIDIADFPHIDYRHDVRTLPMVEDASIDLIYACHVLEYFDRGEAIDVLGEWRRTLRPGGQILLAVPDFEALVSVYMRQGDLALIHGPLYGRWVPFQSGSSAAVYHRTVYDFTSLKGVLEAAGFQTVQRYDWRESEVRSYDDYSQAFIPHMDKEHGTLISLNVQARR